MPKPERVKQLFQRIRTSVKLIYKENLGVNQQDEIEYVYYFVTDLFIPDTKEIINKENIQERYNIKFKIKEKQNTEFKMDQLKIDEIYYVEYSTGNITILIDGKGINYQQYSLNLISSTYPIEWLPEKVKKLIQSKNGVPVTSVA